MIWLIMTENSQGKARQPEQKVGKQMCEMCSLPWVFQEGLIYHKSLLNVEEEEEEEFRMV